MNKALIAAFSVLAVVIAMVGGYMTGFSQGAGYTLQTEFMAQSVLSGGFLKMCEGQKEDQAKLDCYRKHLKDMQSTGMEIYLSNDPPPRYLPSYSSWLFMASRLDKRIVSGSIPEFCDSENKNLKQQCTRAIQDKKVMILSENKYPMPLLDCDLMSDDWDDMLWEEPEYGMALAGSVWQGCSFARFLGGQ